MAFSPLADLKRRIPHGNRQSARQSPIRGVMIHNNHGVNSFGEATNPARQVSAQYWPTYEGPVLPQIDESMRAWTSGAPGYPDGAKADHCMITLEISNAPGFLTSTPPNAIGAVTYAAVVGLIGEIFHRNRLGAVRRGWMQGVMVHQDVVPTSCPGPWLMANLARLITDAERVRRACAGETPILPKRKRNTKMMLQTFTYQAGQYLLMDNGTWIPLYTPAEAKAAQWMIDNNLRNCSQSDNKLVTDLLTRMQKAYFAPLLKELKGK